MAVSIVRLGTPRHPEEGLRLGTVRRPPRGVPRSEYAARDWYDIWYPNLAPSLPTMKMAQQATSDKEWQAFFRKYRAEMATPDNTHTLDLLAALSHRTDFAVGCYCENEAHCHRSALRTLLEEHGALMARR